MSKIICFSSFLNYNTPQVFFKYAHLGSRQHPVVPVLPSVHQCLGAQMVPVMHTHLKHRCDIKHGAYLINATMFCCKVRLGKQLHHLQEILELQCHPFGPTLPVRLRDPGLPFLLWGHLCLANQGVPVALEILFELNTHNISIKGAWRTQHIDNTKWELEHLCHVPVSPACPGSPLSPFGPSKETPGSPLSPVSPWGPGVPGSPLSPLVPGTPGWPGVPGRPGLPFSPEMKRIIFNVMDDVMMDFIHPVSDEGARTFGAIHTRRPRETSTWYTCRNYK